MDERTKAGKLLRERCPLAAHADWKPFAERVDPIDLLIENSRGRIEELIPIRYGRMMADPFAFFRGAAAIMAYDLSRTPATGVVLQACGDCHLLNFGGFATAERKNIFDMNDFDETSVAPWEWNIKRLVASFVVAGRSNGFDAADCRETAWLAARDYREHMTEYGKMPVLQAWYDAIEVETILNTAVDREMKRFYTKKLEAATAKSAHEKEFAKLAFMAGERPRIIDDPPLIYHYADTREAEFLAAAH